LSWIILGTMGIQIYANGVPEVIKACPMRTLFYIGIFRDKKA